MSWSKPTFTAFHQLLNKGKQLRDKDRMGLQTTLAYTALARSLPSLQGLNAYDVLELRERTKPYAQSFRVFISKVAAEAGPDIKPTEYNRWAKNIVNKEIDPVLLELDHVVNDFKIKFSKRLLAELRANINKIAIPVVASALAGLRMDVAAAVALTVILGTSFVEEKLTTKSEINRNPVSFLFEVSKSIKSLT